jgi:membrane-associated HD superfamily phosphohydrolase
MKKKNRVPMSEASAPVRFLSALRGDTVRRLFALMVLSLGAGAFVTEYTRLPVDDIQVGGVASRSIRAVTSFTFVDWEATLERQRSAESRVQQVFDFYTTLSGRLMEICFFANPFSIIPRWKRRMVQSGQKTPPGLNILPTMKRW